MLQRIEGCSDREAVDRFCFDARWKYAAGGLDFDYPGFVHTVLVDMRARLAASQAPNRIFETVLGVCREAGLVGRKRVLDSTPLYDAVATMDTVTLIRSAIRGVLKGAGALQDRVRGVLARDDDYATPGRPVCDWDDRAARAALVDALARDGHAVLGVLDGRELPDGLTQAAQLLATVLGQDLDQDVDGVFAIVRRVAKDRVISTVDPQARHGHKSAARGFDGYKGHLGIDPDSEVITATEVTAGNAGDASVAAELIADLLTGPGATEPEVAEREVVEDGEQGESIDDQAGVDTVADQVEQGRQDADSGIDTDTDTGRPVVYGDNAYGTGEFHDLLEREQVDTGARLSSRSIGVAGSPRTGSRLTWSTSR